MAFVREYVSQEDTDRFKLDVLLNEHLDASDSYQHYWAIDKEATTWLLPIKRLKHPESLWVLHYKDVSIEIKLFHTKSGNYDLISIASNKFNNLEIIPIIQEALNVLGRDSILYATVKERKAQADEEPTQPDTPRTIKRKVKFLDILTAGIIIGILFFIVNESTYNPNPIIKDDNNTSTKLQSIKNTTTARPIEIKYNLCAIRHDGVFLTNYEDFDTNIKIIDSTNQLIACDVDNHGNLYWVDRTTEALYKAQLDGTKRKKILSLPVLASGLAIDNKGKRIFSAQWNLQIKAHEIVYSDFSGSNKTTLISDRNLIRSVNGMFYDYVYDKLYVADFTGQQIVVIDLKTKKSKKLLFSTAPIGVVVDYKNNKVIWQDERDKKIYSVDFDGLNKNVLVDYTFDDNKNGAFGIGALTIDTINDRLLYKYHNRDGMLFTIFESSNLDGSNRIATEGKNPHFSTFTFFNTNVATPKENQHVLTTQNKFTDAPTLQRCFACHGQDWSKSALGKSAIVKDMSQEDIYRALVGYKNGTYGEQMKGLMKGQVIRYSNQELEAIAQTIKSQSN